MEKMSAKSAIVAHRRLPTLPTGAVKINTKCSTFKGLQRFSLIFDCYFRRILSCINPLQKILSSLRDAKRFKQLILRKFYVVYEQKIVELMERIERLIVETMRILDELESTYSKRKDNNNERITNKEEKTLNEQVDCEGITMKT